MGIKFKNQFSETQENKIDALDLASVRAVMVRDEGVSAEEALEIERYYKNFLKLHQKFPHDTIVPTKNIDKMWHAHILHTQQYMRDCYNIFGYYFHHEPHISDLNRAEDKAMKRKFRVTRARYMESCGHDIFMAEEYDFTAQCKNKPKPKPNPSCGGAPACFSPSPGCSGGCSGVCSGGITPTPGLSLKFIEDMMCADVRRQSCP